ncbi:acetolactate synthase large subunit [Actinoallomurus bryophytorum]|uniref:Acetolactate synthase-1/2/3 large subunit n=1 Tax=Actinoallomurus bryophytorum TaxID=1490222 RepID=A0A543CNT5_9ACTN|nr:acetolactate synthase large subunit [Actinoallomurus bryophytorum]TQL98743.1 acetolactate synthase-1/2/3 large subunit [Actinoallomurus bryophytorum]
MSDLNGAHALVRTLVASGVEVCFGNPGTSEMHFVAALDTLPAMRGVLCLHEGVATGAADGYGRMAGRPAAALLHLGPGLANGIANLHNARRAHSPVLAIVGDHATDHQQLDSPLQSDIDALARSVSSWVRRSGSADDLGPDAAAAVAATMGVSRDAPDLDAGDLDAPDRTGTSGSVATLIVPADASWSPGARPADPVPAPVPAAIGADAFRTVAAVLRSGEPAALVLDGAALSEAGLRAADRIARATGTRLFCPTWPARWRRGAGIPAVEPFAYRGEDVVGQLRDVRHLILAGARPPVTSFGYPGRSGALTPPGARVHRMGADIIATLTRLAAIVAPDIAPVPATLARPAMPTGPLTNRTWAEVVGALLPENAIVCDESITAGMGTLPAATAGAPAHDLLGLTGLAIGQGLPLAVGAAIARPERPVICLEADGSAMYTLPALWTQAREHLDITTIILNNRSYAILRAELERVGAATTGGASARMLDLSNPNLDFVALATGMGVPATKATTAEELSTHLAAALATPGPHLIEAVLG